MGSPISPRVPNLCREECDAKALSTSSHPPGLWKRYVDGTFVVIKSTNKKNSLTVSTP